MDNRGLFAKLPATMKSESLNGVLTFILGVLVVVAVVLSLNVAFQLHTYRALNQGVIVCKVNLARAQGLFTDAKAYYQKNPSPELAKILQSVQTKTPTPATR